MLNVGEQLVSSYLRYVRSCNFIETNVYTGKSQGEIDVVGLNLAEQKVYFCEVSIQLENGLNYVDKNEKTNNVPKLTAKFSRCIEYAHEHWSKYDKHFMLWSPIVKNTARTPENNQMRHLEEIKANIKERYCVDIEFIVNEKFQKGLAALRKHAKTETKALPCPLMRLMQIEEYLDKHVKKLTHTQGHESTPILTNESDERDVNRSGPAPVPVSTTDFPYTGKVGLSV